MTAQPGRGPEDLGLAAQVEGHRPLQLQQDRLEREVELPVAGQAHDGGVKRPMRIVLPELIIVGIGLTHLLQLARGYLGDGGRLTTIVGTAGDRTDEALRALGRIAAEPSDHVVVKETHSYLRGRGSVDEMTALYLEGIAAGGDPPHTVARDEPDALEIALRGLRPGDVVAMMCIESGPESRARIEELGGTAKDGQTA